MSAAAATEEPFEWLCILHDQKDALERRLAVRAEHLEGIKRLTQEGFFGFGGVMLGEPITEGKTPAFQGSIMVAIGATKEYVVEVLKKDVYTINRVWDWEKAEIYPYKTSVRAPLPYI